MNEREVIGIEHIEYDNKDGRHIKGIRLYLSFTRERISGRGCESVYIGANRAVAYESACLCKVGSLVEIYFDRFGNPASVSVIE